MRLRHLFALIVLAACDGAPNIVPLPPAMDDTCDASTHAALIGQPVTALERVLILDMVRIIRPGDMVTMDFNPTRINFMIADDDTIRAINCG